MITYKILFTSGLLIMLTTDNALAQEVEDEKDVSPWSIELQLGYEIEPAYTGSDVYVTEPGFNFEVTYSTDAGHEFFVGLGEIGARWELGDDRLLETLLEYEPGRDNEDDSALDGFPEMPDTVEFQVGYEQEIGPFTAEAIVQYDIQNRGKGTVGFIGLGYRNQINSRLGWQLQSDMSFADAEHMAIEVGISENTAQQTGYAAYSPESGYKGVTVAMGLEYAITQQLSLRSEIAVEHYGAIMADSPLIKDEGTPTNYEAIVGFQYEFESMKLTSTNCP